MCRKKLQMNEQKTLKLFGGTSRQHSLVDDFGVFN
jgi:hypothetical protein